MNRFAYHPRRFSAAVTPIEGGEFTPTVALRLGQSGQDLLAGGDDLFANAVSRDASDAVGFHAVLKSAEETALYPEATARRPDHCDEGKGSRLALRGLATASRCWMASELPLRHAQVNHCFCQLMPRAAQPTNTSPRPMPIRRPIVQG
jgi:hypothetical protein